MRSHRRAHLRAQLRFARTLVVWALMAWALVSALAPAQASAQELTNLCYFPIRAVTPGVTSCVTSASCAIDHRCLSGYCQRIPGTSDEERAEAAAERAAEREGAAASQGLVAPPLPTGQAECDQDRRCRINRLRRQSNARRYVQLLQQEEVAMRYQRVHQDRLISDIPRRVSPIHTDLMASFLGYGVSAGYTFAGRFRLALGFEYFDQYLSVTVEELGNAFFDADVEAAFVHLEGTYLLRESWWSPYVSAQLIYGQGSLDSFNEFGFGGGAGRSLTMHVIKGVLGMDMQSSFGLRGRIGLVALLPIYTRVAFGPGSYDDFAKSGIEAYFASEIRFGPEVSLGWSF